MKLQRASAEQCLFDQGHVVVVLLLRHVVGYIAGGRALNVLVLLARRGYLRHSWTIAEANISRIHMFLHFTRLRDVALGLARKLGR